MSIREIQDSIRVIIDERVKECLSIYKTTIEKSEDEDKIQKALDMHFLNINEDAWYRLQYIPEMLKQVKAKLYETLMDIIHNISNVKNKMNSEIVRANNVDLMLSNGLFVVVLYKLENLLDPYQRQRIMYLNDMIKKKNGKLIIGILNDTPQHTRSYGVDCYHGNTFMNMIFPFKDALNFILQSIKDSIGQSGDDFEEFNQFNSKQNNFNDDIPYNPDYEQKPKSNYRGKNFNPNYRQQRDY